MKAVIRQWFDLQKELDELGLTKDYIVDGIPEVIRITTLLLQKGYNVQILQNGKEDINTVIYVCKKGERFVQR